MGTLRKYEFTSKTKYNNTLKLLEDKPQHKPIVLGKIVLVNAEYDEELKEVKPAILSKMYCVDIYWNDKEDTSIFDAFEVFPITPSHTIS